MNILERFGVHIDHDIVTIHGAARYVPPTTHLVSLSDTVSAEPLTFGFTLATWRDLWAFEHMINDPLDTHDRLSADGYVDLNGGGFVVSAVQITPSICWTAPGGELQVRLAVEAFDHNLEECELPVDEAIAFLDLAPADCAWMRREVRRASVALRELHPLK